MSIVLGIESTAHTFGVGVVKNGKVLSNVKRTYTTKKGGIIPMDAAKHHSEVKEEVYAEALENANISEDKINVIAFSQGPGLAPCLLEGMRFAKELTKKLKVPIVPVNHCVAHLEIGKVTNTNSHRSVYTQPSRCRARAQDPKARNEGAPVMLYVSGANTQIIAYSSGKYRIFGETLDIGVGNFIDNFGRYAGLGFPAGPKVEELAKCSRSYVELPYNVKGMDVALSGILTKLKNMIESKSPRDDSSKDDSGEPSGEPKYKIEDLAYSMQETVFAMLVETAERALAHTGKNELLLGGGVGCNKRLQEMCEIMCGERGANFFCPPASLLVDNGAMIAYLGEIMFKSGIKEKGLDKIDIIPRQRTDEVQVSWKS